MKELYEKAKILFESVTIEQWDIVIYVCIALIVLILASFMVQGNKTPKNKKASKMGAFYCSECHRMLSDVDRLYSNGRCPHCGTKKRGAGDIVSSYQN